MLSQKETKHVNKQDRIHFYTSYLQETKELLEQLKRRSNWWLTAKIIIFLSGVLFIYLGFSRGWNGNVYGVVLSLLIYISAAKLDARNLNRIETAQRVKQTLENEISTFNGDFSNFPNGKEYIEPSHEYTYDLDIFGEKSLFQRLNRTITKEGSDRLAQWLSHYPTDERLTNERKVTIDELSENRKVLVRFISVPRQEEKRLRTYINVLKEQRDNKAEKQAAYTTYFCPKIIMACVSLIITWGLLFCAISGICSWYLFGLLFFIQLLAGFSHSKRTSRMLNETEGLHKSFAPYLSILQFVQERDFKTPYLQNISKELSKAGKSFKLLSNLIQALYCRINDIMFILLNGMILFDIFMLRGYECWKHEAIKNMEHWIDLLADTDALVSLAVYKFDHPENTSACFLDETSPNIIEATEMFHPFLAEEKAVGNDLLLKATEMMIVTGANMAGKSTFLRTVGINYVMAMNGIPVCAKTFRMKKVALFSSMRTADNLASHISYFHAELLRLQQLVEFCKQKAHTLIILDEILKGTNSEDKLKGSILFLRKMLLLPVTGIVATHDLKLSDLEKEDSHFQNYCFEIGLGKDISYSYKIKKGVARNLNATYLLNEILEKITPQ